MRRALLPLLALLGCEGVTASRPAAALDPPDLARPEALVQVAPEALSTTLPLSDALATALATRDHKTAVVELQKLDPKALPGAAVPDRAFLLAWELVRAGQAVEAGPLIAELGRSESAPAAYRVLLTGEVQEALGRHVEAAATLDGVPHDSRLWPRAALEEAESNYAAERTKDARQIWKTLIERPDPSEGNDRALLALATRSGLGSEEAYPLLRRIWARYPTTKASTEAEKALAPYELQGAKYQATRAELAARADALQRAERWDDVIALVGPALPRLEKLDADSCRARYAYGRALFKKNRLTESVTALTPVGAGCAGLDDDAGAQSWYIVGKATERRKMWAEAGAAYQKIPAMYPNHSMADDGYALAGIALQEAGSPQQAVGLWEAQVERYPDGDLAAEGFWRLGWSRYLAGDAQGAIAWVEKSIWSVPLDADPVHALAARYWAARWRLYPSVDDPRALSDAPDQRALGIRLLGELCREHPSTYYAGLAASRLYEIAPDELSHLPRPELSGDDSLWVRASFAADPVVNSALALARLGLISDAMSELDALSQDAMTPSELALVTRVQARVDPVVAHNRLHHFLLQHPPATLGADAGAILRQAYPDLYWQELQEVTSDYPWDARIFHGLVREESSFNPTIVSWAGARGLSQLMPATARAVGKEMGLTVSNQLLFDPKTNLSIGSHYFDSLMGRYRGSPYLAAAGYNAGPGNVDGWLGRFGNVPTDELIERIPIRETRAYVKRVLGTYQAYHLLYDPDPLFADWSRLNHKARPDSAH